MALVCRECKSDHVQTGVGNRGKCLQCGKDIDLTTGYEAPKGLVWTSEVPEAVARTAAVTQVAAS